MAYQILNGVKYGGGPSSSNIFINEIIKEEGTSVITQLTIDEDCYINSFGISNNTAAKYFYINDIDCCTKDASNGIWYFSFNGFIKKGDSIKTNLNLKIFSLK